MTVSRQLLWSSLQRVQYNQHSAVSHSLISSLVERFYCSWFASSKVSQISHGKKSHNANNNTTNNNAHKNGYGHFFKTLLSLDKRRNVRRSHLSVCPYWPRHRWPPDWSPPQQSLQHSQRKYNYSRWVDGNKSVCRLVFHLVCCLHAHIATLTAWLLTSRSVDLGRERGSSRKEWQADELTSPLNSKTQVHSTKSTCDCW